MNDCPNAARCSTEPGLQASFPFPAATFAARHSFGLIQELKLEHSSIPLKFNNNKSWLLRFSKVACKSLS
jgi:hypothetical protein